MFRLYIFNQHQAAYRTLKENYKMQINKVVGGDIVFELCTIIQNYIKYMKICRLKEDYVKLYRL